MTRLQSIVLGIVLLIGIPAGHAQLTIGPVGNLIKTVDLAIEGPVLPPAPLKGYTKVSWTVRNAGNSASPDSALLIDCHVLYADELVQSTCSTEQEGGIGSVPIPPLMAGQTYKVDRQMFYVYFDPNQLSRFRFALEATVDPKNSIIENNENNNKITFIAENFQGPAPGPATFVLNPALFLPPPATAQAATTLQVTATPQLEIYSQTKPWNPTEATWVVVKNVGAVDAPAVSLSYDCYQYTWSFDTLSVVEMWYASQSFAVPPLKPGEFKAIFYFLGPPAGKWYNNITIPMPFRAIFSIVGEAKAKDLWLATYKPKIAI